MTAPRTQSASSQQSRCRVDSGLLGACKIARRAQFGLWIVLAKGINADEHVLVLEIVYDTSESFCTWLRGDWPRGRTPIMGRAVNM